MTPNNDLLADLADLEAALVRRVEIWRDIIAPTPAFAAWLAGEKRTIPPDERFVVVERIYRGSFLRAPGSRLKGVQPPTEFED